jgi:VanZ family protein
MSTGHPVRRAAAAASNLPLALRWALVGASLCLVFWLSLSPSDEIPTVNVSDKVEHAVAFLLLTLAYGLMFPRRRVAVILGVALLGVSIEVLQAVMPFNRQAEFADLVADAVGIAAGLMMLRLLAGPAKLPT